MTMRMAAMIKPNSGDSSAAWGYEPNVIMELLEVSLSEITLAHSCMDKTFHVKKNVIETSQTDGPHNDFGRAPSHVELPQHPLKPIVVLTVINHGVSSEAFEGYGVMC
jgi:hypothetical protein